MSCTLLAHQEETRRVDAFMQLPMVRNVLSTGVDRNLVRYAIEGMLRETGTGVLYKVFDKYHSNNDINML